MAATYKSTCARLKSLNLSMKEVIRVSLTPRPGVSDADDEVASNCRVKMSKLDDGEVAVGVDDDWWRTEYADDVLHNYVLKERTALPPFRSQSPQLNMRRCLVDWVALLAEQMTLNNRTLHLAVYLLDHFMDNHDIEDNRLQLAVLGCLSIASKFEERDSQVPRLGELSKAANNMYTLREFLQMEMMLLKYFEWNLSIPTAAHFAECFTDVAFSVGGDLLMGSPIVNGSKIRTHIDEYVKYFLDLSLQDQIFLRFLPSLVAAACHASSRICIGLTPVWSVSLLKKTKYELDELIPCIDIMMRSHEADQMAARSSMKRKNEENRTDSKRVDSSSSGSEKNNSSPDSDTCSR